MNQLAEEVKYEQAACLTKTFDTAFEGLRDDKDAKDIAEFERTQGIATIEPPELQIEDIDSWILLKLAITVSL